MYLLRTHVVRSPSTGWYNTNDEQMRPPPRWGTFMVSIQALGVVPLLASYESVLRILSISPNKNITTVTVFLSIVSKYEIGASRVWQIMLFHKLSFRRDFRRTPLGNNITCL